MTGVPLCVERRKRNYNKQLTHAAAAVCKKRQGKKAEAIKEAPAKLSELYPSFEEGFQKSERQVSGHCKCNEHCTEGRYFGFLPQKQQQVPSQSTETERRKPTLFTGTPIIQTVSLETGPTHLPLPTRTTRVREVGGCAQGHRAGRYRSHDSHSGLPETKACVPSSTLHSLAPSQELQQQWAGWLGSTWAPDQIAGRKCSSWLGGCGLPTGTGESPAGRSWNLSL